MKIEKQNSLKNSLIAIAELIRLPRNLLLPPFAIATAFAIHLHADFDFTKLIWIVLAVISGFMSGNVFNAIVDRDIDAVNPRTKNRPVADGRISCKKAVMIFGVLILLLILSVVMLDPKLLLLLPFPVIVYLTYSYTKRFTWLCHFVISACYAMVPLAVATVYGKLFTVAAFSMAAMVATWNFGFEMIYSSQDLEYDIASNLHSIPVKFGLDITKRLSQIAYLMCFLLLIAQIFISDFGLLYVVGVFIGGLFLLWQQILVYKHGIKAFKYLIESHQLFSLVIMGAIIIDRII